MRAAILSSLDNFKNLNSLQTVGYKELFDFCPACDETGNTVEALMKGLFHEAKKLQKERDEILKINRAVAKDIEELKRLINSIGNLS